MKIIITIGLMALYVCTAHADDILDRKTVTSRKYVDDQIATKQPVLNPDNTDLRDNVVMYTNQAGTVTAKPISTTLSGDGIDNNLPTVGAVNTGLSDKQNIIGENKTAGNVATYTSSAGTLDEHAVYKTNVAYNANGLVEAGHVNTAIQNGLNEHITCVETNKDPVTGNCWLYTINDQATGTIYTAHTN